MDDPDAPIALEAYQKLAQGYAAIAETKAENGYIEHPAIRQRIGDVTGLRVLDAGCGPGFLVRDLLAGGAARVIGVDVSPEMIRITTERVGDRAELHVHDLARPLSMIGDGTLDLVTSSLTLDYVRDWSRPLGEFRRCLTDRGRLVMSVQHPMASYKWLKPPSAFGVHYCEVDWGGFTAEPVTVPDYYRSFEEILNPVLAAGFALRGVTETRPLDALKTADPRRYEKHSVFPTFLILDVVVA